jgi:16S rRNA (cytidine1402-2'-O)-methyltransferase
MTYHPEKSALYIVATPIGHLDDITYRAVRVLQTVDVIAAEDTRYSRALLTHLGIQKPLVSLNEHNERNKALSLLQQVAEGAAIALISDAGTPLISDPGYHLVRLAHEQHLKVVPIPGPCAAIAALSVSGLPTDHFRFEGFLPVKTVARRKSLAALAAETRTLIFYEAPHRIIETLSEMVACFGSLREAVFVRELTKTFETIKGGTLSELLKWVQEDENQRRGECVILVAGAPTVAVTEVTPEVATVLKLLLEELSLKQASSLAAKITGVSKRALYEYAIKTKPFLDEKD